MILFRQCDSRYPFLWEDDSQPAARWHGDGEGPAHYLADTPDGAWAELLRHEEITDPADLVTLRRALWAIELSEAAVEPVNLPAATLTGGPATYEACRTAARRLRAKGVARLRVPSAALRPGLASGYRVADGSVRRAEPRDGWVVVVFGAPHGLVGWRVADDARPGADLLDAVRHYR